MLGALAVALWLGMLWYAAPLAGGDADEPADRIAGALVLGVAIAFALGFVHALTAPGLFAAAALACLVSRARSARATRRTPGLTRVDRIAIAAVAFVAVAVAWPALVRPLLEGDSLQYHLPNAAAWARGASVWDVSTRYWWYPGASELFAAGLVAVGGPLSAGIAGTMALLLLGCRIVAWGRRIDVPPMLSASAACATIAALPAALQAGNLQNDVWLAAFFLELLYDARFAPRKLAGDGAVCALLKPYGWAFALYGLCAARRPRALVLPALACALWAARDALLWNRAIIPPGSVAFPAMAQTTVLGNGLAALGELVRVLAWEDPWLLVVALAPFVALATFGARDRALSFAGVAAFLAFLVLPFSYRNALPQLAAGQSLRFALPALAVGAVVILAPMRRVALLATVALGLATAVGVWRVAGIFWIDPQTHDALLAACALALAIAVPPARFSLVAVPLVAAALIATAAVRAGHDRLARYDELFLPERTLAFDWIARERPARLVVSDVPAGAIDAVSPLTDVFDVLDPAPCEEARALGADLMYRIHPPPEKTVFPSAVAQLAHCGTTLYDDGTIRVVLPSGDRDTRVLR